MADNKQSKKGASSSANEQSPPPTWLSWSIRGVSVLLILGLLVYFVVVAFQPKERPRIEFSIEEDKVEQRGTGWALPVLVTNESGMSVHSLKIKGALTQVQGKPEETADILLLGPNEEVSVTLWFDEDPRGKGVQMSVGSYLLP